MALAVTSWTLWVGTVALVALGGPSIWTMDPGSISLTGWPTVVYSGVLAIAVAYLIWNHGSSVSVGHEPPHSRIWYPSWR